MDGCKKMTLESSSAIAAPSYPQTNPNSKNNDQSNEYGDETINDENPVDEAQDAPKAEAPEFHFKQDAFATKIALLDRGNCSFVTKVRNAERAGASLVVVVDDRDEDIKNVIMGDDGTGMGIRIPSMLIGKDSGKILKEFA